MEVRTREVSESTYTCWDIRESGERHRGSETSGEENNDVGMVCWHRGHPAGPPHLSRVLLQVQLGQGEIASDFIGGFSLPQVSI